MSDSRSITGIIIFAGILLFAAWLGVSIVTDQLKTLMYIAAGGTLIICALLGRKIWLIIPFASALNFSLMIPGNPDTLLLAQALFLGFCVLLFLLRRLPLRIQFTEMEFWILVLCICVGQVYLRNPVGLNIFGGASVGARPYAIFGATLLTSLILCNLRVPISDLKWLLRLQIIGGLLNFFMLTVGHFVPRLGVWYGAADLPGAGGEEDLDYGSNRANRIGFLGEISNNIALWISSFKSPIRACFHPVWAPFVLLSFAFAALSGFRNEIATVGLTYLVGIAYRGGFPSVAIASFALFLGVVMLALLNLALPLPANIQRSLSFLPGTWEETHVKDAEGSTEWRVAMWKEALLTDNWIQNKWLGDGLGMTREELTYISSFGAGFTSAQSQAKTSALSLQQEFMMASNNYHSGPVSTIRAIGYFGLCILILAQIRLAFHAHRLIKRARNTEWLPLTLMISIPLIILPFFWIFIYGSFGGGIAALLTGIAMIRLLQNNLPISISNKTQPSIT